MIVIAKNNLLKTLILRREEKKIKHKIRKEKLLFFQIQWHLNKLPYYSNNLFVTKNESKITLIIRENKK